MNSSMLRPKNSDTGAHHTWGGLRQNMKINYKSTDSSQQDLANYCYLFHIQRAWGGCTMRGGKGGSRRNQKKP